MVVKADTYKLDIWFDKDRSLSWTKMTEADIENVRDNVAAQGLPFVVSGANGWALINPTHVRSVTAYLENVPCPKHGNSRYLYGDKCSTPEYHRGE